MNSNDLLAVLPPYTNTSVTIKKTQTVNDIVREVLEAHAAFAPHYDSIAAFFDNGSNATIARNLFDFLKSNVRYKIEPEEKQTTKSPAAILSQAQGDCKHYAGFIAGVLDALNRQGRKIDFHYRFASYNLFRQEPRPCVCSDE
jgi:transglutaminase-like putative cysteine protease